MEKSAPASAPDAPPSYQESVGQPPYIPTGAPGGAAGGFVAGPPPMDPTKGVAPGYPGQPYPQQQGVPPGYAAPGGVAPAGAAPPPQQVVVVVQAPRFGPYPVDMLCPHCQCQIKTTTESEPGPMAWILAGVLCVVGLWPCACVPCCIESLNTVSHKCPNCKHFLGRYKGGL